MADEVKLIDADKLIGYLHERYFWDDDDRDMVFKAIEEQPTIESEPVNGWISVEDRLPEPETWVLVYIEYPKPVFEMERGISKTDAVKKVFFDGKSMYNNYGNITHWQPLPKSPKKLSREESNELLYGNYEEDRKTMIGNNE